MIVQEITPRDSGAASDGGRWIPSTRCLVRVILGIARRVATCLVLNAVRINLTYRRQVRRHGPQAAGRGPEDGGAARGALPQSPAGDGDRRAVRRGGVLRHPRSGAGQVRDGAGGPRGRRSRHASGGRVRVLPAVVLRHGGRAGGRRAAGAGRPSPGRRKRTSSPLRCARSASSSWPPTPLCARKTCQARSRPPSACACTPAPSSERWPGTGSSIPKAGRGRRGTRPVPLQN